MNTPTQPVAYTNAARTLERILNAKYPGYTFTVDIRPPTNESHPKP